MADRSLPGISEDDWEGCLEAVREVLRRAVRHKEDNRANDQKVGNFSHFSLMLRTVSLASNVENCKNQPHFWYDTPE